MSKTRFVSYKSNSATFIRGLKRHVGKNLDKAGDWMVRGLIQSFGTPGPPASRPGQYPRRRSGRLAKSIKKTRRGMTMRVGPRVNYARKLAKKDRKMAPEFLWENRAAVFYRIIGNRGGRR